MSEWSNDDAVDEPLGAADIARLTHFAASAVSSTRKWLPGPKLPIGWQSQAESEINNSEVRLDGSPWGARPVRTAYSVSAMFLIAAGESLTAMAASLSEATTPLVPGILARSTIEAGSKAAWLMEPSASPRERVVRWVLCRAASAYHLERTSNAVDPGADVARYGETLAKVEADVTALDLAVTFGKQPACEGVTYPTYTQRANALVGPLASGAYNLYSGMAHAELYAVLQSWVQGDPDDDGNPVVLPHTGRRAVYAAFATAGLALVRPARTVLGVLGLPGKHAEAWRWEQKVHDLERALGPVSRT